MISIWKLGLLAALVATLTIAPAAEAHTLKIPRAANANKTFVKLACDGINEDVEDEASCVASRPARCTRLSPHRVRCGFFLNLELEDGSLNRCFALNDWTIPGRSNRLKVKFLGTRNCAELRPPSEEPAP